MPDTIERSTGEILPGAYPKEIAAAIAQVMGADLYVQKRGKNQFHGYKYATVGDLLDKLQPLMSEAGLVILQNELTTDFLDGGNVMVTRYQFTLAHTSGAVWPDRPIHTGMSACRNSKGGFDDKAANKCHTAARKYFLLGLFQVPTGEDFRQAAHDADADHHDDAPPPAEAAQHPASGTKPNGTRKAAPKIAPEDENWRRLANEIKDAIDAHTTLKGLNEEMILRGELLTSPDPKEGSELAAVKTASDTAYAFLIDRANKRRAALANAPKEAA